MPGLPVSWNSKLFRTSQLRERASPWFVLCFTVRWLPGGTSCRRMQDTLFVDVTTNICSSHWITCRTVLVFSLSFFFFFSSSFVSFGFVCWGIYLQHFPFDLHINLHFSKYHPFVCRLVWLLQSQDSTWWLLHAIAQCGWLCVGCIPVEWHWMRTFIA